MLSINKYSPPKVFEGVIGGSFFQKVPPKEKVSPREKFPLRKKKKETLGEGFLGKTDDYQVLSSKSAL